jgi:hypothetical protein
MKIWSKPHSDMGNRLNYNGPKVDGPDVPGCCPSEERSSECSWLYAGNSEYPALPRLRGDNATGADNQQERPNGLWWRERRLTLDTVSDPIGILRGHTPATSFDDRGEEMVRASWRHGDNLSEIPCRVSSDLHEWRNDFPTVSTTDPAKLKYE